MKFAKIIFAIAGVWGILVLVPFFFLVDLMGRKYAPPSSYPHFFYGFFALALVFQFVFFIIASDPARFRPMIIASILEKVSYVAVCAVLYSRGQITLTDASTCFADCILGILFVFAYFATRPKTLTN
jgi:hypothetical protein